MDVKLAIFDFDGTLVDTKKAIVVAKQKTMKEMNLPVVSEEDCISTIGLSAKLGFQKLYPNLQEDELDLCVKNYRDNFEKLKEDFPPEVFPGVLETLDLLKQKGVVCTIATSRNRKSLLEFLDQLNLADYFSYILAGEDTPLLKPNPDAVLKTLEELSFNKEDALVIGDMPYDILMGKNAGVKTCGVTYGNASRENLLKAGADYIINKMDELIQDNLFRSK